MTGIATAYLRRVRGEFVAQKLEPNKCRLAVSQPGGSRHQHQHQHQELADSFRPFLNGQNSNRATVDVCPNLDNNRDKT